MRERHGLTLFQHEPPFWSAGDRLHLTLEWDDEPAMRPALAALGLESILGAQIGDVRVELGDEPVIARLYGPLVTLSVEPEDPFDHLETRHFALAARIEAAVRAAGLERAIRPRLADDDVHRGQPPPAALRALTAADLMAAPRWLVEVVDPLEVQALARLDARGSSRPRAEIGPETRIVDARGIPLSGLAPGDLAIGRLAVGRRRNDLLGMVALDLGRVDVDPSATTRVAQWAQTLASIGRDPGVDAAAVVRAAAIDASIDSPDDPDVARELADALDERTIALLYARPCTGWPSIAAIVDAMLASMRDLRVPCLGSARRLREDAVVRVRGGTPFDDVERALFEETSEWIDRGLAAVGDARRMLPIGLASRGARWVAALTPESRDRLAAGGVSTVA